MISYALPQPNTPLSFSVSKSRKSASLSSTTSSVGQPPVSKVQAIPDPMASKRLRGRKTKKEACLEQQKNQKLQKSDKIATTESNSKL
jgi:hypothetical protein